MGPLIQEPKNLGSHKGAASRSPMIETPPCPVRPPPGETPPCLTPSQQQGVATHFQRTSRKSEPLPFVSYTGPSDKAHVSRSAKVVPPKGLRWQAAAVPSR